MLRYLLIAIAMLFCANVDAEVKVSAEMEVGGLFEQLPLKGNITISHPSGEHIDEASFRIGNKSLAVEKINEVKMTAVGDLKLTTYGFKLDPQAKGLHVLPEISVAVGGTTYRTPRTTYEVLSFSPTDVEKEPEGSKEVLLKLEAFVEGPKTLYPGQKTVLGYRYIYSGDIETTVEETPLLQAKGLIKVGDKIIKRASDGDLSILQVSQPVQGDKPGEYTYGPSILEGLAYKQTSPGRRVYSRNKLSTAVPPITIEVKQFPESGKPASFNGSLGNFSWQTSLTSTPNVNIGDEMEMSIAVTGKGEFDTVNLPELCCQPGMSGLFRLSDLPPVGQVQGETKRFIVKLTPLSDSAKEIPALEFASFDPDAQKYIVSKSNPIPITVTQFKPTQAPVKKTPAQDVKIDWKKELVKATPIQIQGNQVLSKFDLYNRPFGTWWSLLLIPFGAGLLLFQRNMKRYLEQAKKEIKEKASGDYLEEAMQTKLGSQEQYSLLNRAFLLRLVETGEIASPNINPERLQQEGVQGEVREFLMSMEANRYAGGGDKQDEIMLRKARSLFTRIGGNT